MRVFFRFFLVVAFCLAIFNSTESLASVDSKKWDRASKTMIKALQGENEGLQVSVLQKIIRYGEVLNKNGLALNVMHTYREHKNEMVRQLALVALYKMKSNWGMLFLRRAVKFEESPVLQKRIYAILCACENQNQDHAAQFALAGK